MGLIYSSIIHTPHIEEKKDENSFVFLLDDYADWEGAYLSSALNQHPDWEVKTISTKQEVISIGGFTTKVDLLLHERPKTIDLVVMIGGNSWNLVDGDIATFVKKSLNDGIVVDAICGAVDYLSKNGLLTNRLHTGNSSYVWADYDQYVNGEDFIEKQAVVDHGLITANGTAALEWTDLVLKTIEFDTVDAIEKRTYMNQHGFYRYCDKFGNPFI